MAPAGNASRPSLGVEGQPTSLPLVRVNGRSKSESLKDHLLLIIQRIPRCTRLLEAEMSENSVRGRVLKSGSARSAGAPGSQHLVSEAEESQGHAVLGV